MAMKIAIYGAELAAVGEQAEVNLESADSPDSVFLWIRAPCQHLLAELVQDAHDARCNDSCNECPHVGEQGIIMVCVSRAELLAACEAIRRGTRGEE